MFELLAINAAILIVLVLILPFVLHVWKNWRPFLAYFKRLPMALSLGLCVVAGLVFDHAQLGSDLRDQAALGQARCRRVFCRRRPSRQVQGHKHR